MNLSRWRDHDADERYADERDAAQEYSSFLHHRGDDRDELAFTTNLPGRSGIEGRLPRHFSSPHKVPVRGGRGPGLAGDELRKATEEAAA